MTRIGLLRWFDGLRIRSKMLGGYGLLVAIALILAVVGTVAAISARNAFDSVVGVQYLLIDAGEDMRHRAAIILWQAEHLTNGFEHNHGVMLPADPPPAPSGEDEDAFTTDLPFLLGDFLRELMEYEEAAAKIPGEEARMAMISERAVEFANLGYLLLQRRQDGADTEVVARMMRSLEASGAKLMVELAAAVKRETDSFDDQAMALDSTILRTIAIVVTLGLVGTAASAWLGFWLSNRIVAPLSRLQRAMARVGEGDFQAPDIAGAGDEIGTLIASFSDMTAELREAKDKLVRNERLSALGQIAGSVSHELRNPLGTIRNSMGMVRQLTVSKGLGVERALDRIERSVQRCDAIVGDILEFSRVQELNREATPLDDWLNEMLDEHEVPPAVTVERELRASGMAMLDRTRFRQVLVNLLDNAAQAMLEPDWASASGRTARIVVRSEAAGPHLRLSVRDNGPGITEDRLGRIFEPLFTTKTRGVGLGLPTVRKLVEQHGGAIDVESTVGEGTTFTVWLPRVSRQSQTESAADGFAIAV